MRDHTTRTLGHALVVLADKPRNQSTFYGTRLSAASWLLNAPAAAVVPLRIHAMSLWTLLSVVAVGDNLVRGKRSRMSLAR